MKRSGLQAWISLLCVLALLLGMSSGALTAEAADVKDFKWTQRSDGTLCLTAYLGAERNLFLPAEIDGKAVTEIGEACFAGLLCLDRVHIPEGVVRIGDYAFECCSALRKVYLPESLKQIGIGAFSGCGSLSLVDLQEGLESIGKGAFLCCDALVQLELPASLKELGDFAFSGCQALASVRFAGDAVTKLPDRLFYDCTGLSRLVLPQNVRSIGKRAFAKCESLTNLYFGQPLTDLGAYAFEDCGKLTSLTLNAEALPTGLLSGCSSLSWFSVSDRTLSIAPEVFRNDAMDLSISASVKEIRPGAFYGFSGSISLEEENSSYQLLEGSLYTADGKTLIAYFPADPWAEEPQTEFVLPEGVERIASFALAETQLSSVILPRSLKQIDAYAFAGSDLEGLEIPEGVQVDPAAFKSPGEGGEEGEPEEPGEEVIPEIIGSVAGDKNLFREADYADYKEISNEEFEAWGQQYLAWNKAHGVELTAQTIPYIIRYKGEVIPHFMPMTAVQNRDPYMWAEAASFFGDDFEQTYLMMDHGLSTELHRGRMQDNLILYSGLYDSQLMAAAGTDTLPSQQQLVDAIGTSFSDPIMISTTTDPAVAAGFGDTLFIIYASKEAMEGLGAICIDAVVSSSEKEILMDANARYRILDVGNMAITQQDPWDETPTTLYRGYVKVELLPPEAQEQELPAFEDVPEGRFYHDAVYWAAARGIAAGITETRFCPEQEATRAQVLTFLWRAAGCPEPKSLRNPFTDVPAGKFYTKAVLWAAEQGIAKGDTASSFSPGKTCTRGEFMTFLYRFVGKPGVPAGTVNPFRDVAAGRYYTAPILWAAGCGIAKGTTADSFSPEKTCTRGEIVTFLYRALK